MRGTDHSRDESPDAISLAGVEVFAPGVTIQRNAHADQVPAFRLSIGISTPRSSAVGSRLCPFPSQTSSSKGIC